MGLIKAERAGLVLKQTLGKKKKKGGVEIEGESRREKRGGARREWEMMKSRLSEASEISPLFHFLVVNSSKYIKKKCDQLFLP